MGVLFMSGYTDDEVMRRGVIDGGTAFLQKPFTPAQFAVRCAMYSIRRASKHSPGSHPDESPHAFLNAVKSRPPLAIRLLAFIAVVLVGGSLTADMTGQSAADQYILARWSFEGLRVYLWLRRECWWQS